jgi:hypothetical protein
MLCWYVTWTYNTCAYTCAHIICSQLTPSCHLYACMFKAYAAGKDAAGTNPRDSFKSTWSEHFCTTLSNAFSTRTLLAALYLHTYTSMKGMSAILQCWPCLCTRVFLYTKGITCVCVSHHMGFIAARYFCFLVQHSLWSCCNCVWAGGFRTTSVHDTTCKRVCKPHLPDLIVSWDVLLMLCAAVWSAWSCCSESERDNLLYYT